MLLANSENLTPQPRNPRKGRGSRKAPLHPSRSPLQGERSKEEFFFMEGLGRGLTPQLIRQQYPLVQGLVQDVSSTFNLSTFQPFNSL